MLAKNIGAATALALAALIITAGTASADSQQTGSHRSRTITLRACNHTNSTVLVASSFIPVGGQDWRNKGWTAVSAGQCLNIFDTNNYTFYARAEVKNDSDSFWGTDIDQCVEYPGPYDFYTKSEDTSCPEGEPAKFSTFRSDGRPVYVWNLNPPD